MTMDQKDRLVVSFAQRIAAGEYMGDPVDLQFYENNSEAIEKALRQIQIVDDAKSKYSKHHEGSVYDNMTQRIYGINQWGNMSEQEMINLICDIRRRFE